jgi:uncharacterized protein with PIN domain
LRAAGYDALWEQDITDDELLRRAKQSVTLVLTTDSLLMERAVLRDGLIPAFWLPPTLSLEQQLTLVLREFRLPLLAPRCMQCGGELRLGDKEALEARIPPKTYRWLNEFFICNRCGQLFWHGTHWEKIRRKLEAMRGPV